MIQDRLLLLFCILVNSIVYSQTCQITSSNETAGLTNVATAGTAFATGSYTTDVHYYTNINDGTYGNSYSWISDGVSINGNIFVGISWSSSQGYLKGIKLGRDNNGQYGDRLGWVSVETTQVSSPNENTPNSDWTYVGDVYNDMYQGYYELDPYSSASSITGIRIITTDSGLCIDELSFFFLTSDTSDSSSCDAGYTSSITCGSDGNFGNATCVAKSCTASQVANSDYASTGSITGVTGDVISITCDAGYSGSDTVTCGTDGNFDELTCNAYPSLYSVYLKSGYLEVTFDIGTEMAGIALTLPLHIFTYLIAFFTFKLIP